MSHLNEFLFSSNYYVNERVASCRSLLLANAEDSSVLLGSEESDDGVGAHTEVVGGETSPEASHALLGHRLGEAVSDGLVWKLAIGASLLLLHLRLDVVEGQGADSRGDGSDHGATELDLEGAGIGAHRLGGDVLGRVVRHEHADVERASSHHGGHGTLPERGDTFLADDTREGIDDVLVVATLSLRESRVGLHTHESEIAWVANKGTERTGTERGTSTLQSGKVLTSVPLCLDVLSQVEVDTKTECSINGLSQKSRVESTKQRDVSKSIQISNIGNLPLVESLRSARAIDLLGDGDGRCGATRFGSELDTNLDHVHWLNLFTKRCSQSLQCS